MTTLLAVARDAFREAKDRKISRVMIAISVAVAFFCSIFGFIPLDAEALARGSAREAGIGAAYRFEAVDARTVDVVTDEGESSAGFLGSAAEHLAHALERRGVRRVEIAPQPPAGGVARSRLRLEGDPLRVRGGVKVSVLFGAWVVDPEKDLGDAGPSAFPAGQELLIMLEETITQLIAGWAGLIIVIIATAGFVPSMLVGGTAHLFLAKPVRRSTLLLGKYVGGVAFVVLHAVVITTLVSAAIYLRTGFFEPRFLATPAAIASVFAILYSVSCLAGVLVETPVVSILATLAFWLFCWLVSTAKWTPARMAIMQEEMGGEVPFKFPEAAVKVVDAVYFVLPKPTDIFQLFERYMSTGPSMSDSARMAAKLLAGLNVWMVAGTSAAFTAAVLGLACWVFSRRDY
jgi:ABC-type transport system involved in multi-copper enzyme maturation permease subunit